MEDYVVFLLFRVLRGVLPLSLKLGAGGRIIVDVKRSTPEGCGDTRGV